MRILPLLVLVLFACQAWTAEVPASAGIETHPFLRTATKALVGADGKKSDQAALLTPKYVFVYFSAHWCPSCQQFTPELVKFYKEKGGGRDFSILFVSSDEDEKRMLAYMKEAAMPWSGLRFGSSKLGEINKRYGGPGIPCLTLLDDKDEVVAHSYVDGTYVGPHAVLRRYEQLGAAPAAVPAPAAAPAKPAVPAGDITQARSVDEFVARAGKLTNYGRPVTVQLPMAPVADLGDHRGIYEGATRQDPADRHVPFTEVRVLEAKQAVIYGKNTLVMRCELRGKPRFLVIDISDPKRWFADLM